MTRPLGNESYGFRAHQGWGDGPAESTYAVGDIVWIPNDCPGVEDDRCEPGLARILSVFSIDEGPSFYYRVQRVEPYYNRGYRLRVVSTDRYCSDRLHVIRDHTPGRDGRPVPDCDYTEGFVLLHSASRPSGEALSTHQGEGRSA